MFKFWEQSQGSEQYFADLGKSHFKANHSLLISLLNGYEDQPEALLHIIQLKASAFYLYLIGWNIRWESQNAHLEFSCTPAAEDMERPCFLTDCSLNLFYFQLK